MGSCVGPCSREHGKLIQGCFAVLGKVYWGILLLLQWQCGWVETVSCNDEDEKEEVEGEEEVLVCNYCPLAGTALDNEPI